jgi:hypothetical protein
VGCYGLLQEFLRNSGKLEAPAEEVLKCLGELKRAYLKEFEEKLLSFIKNVRLWIGLYNRHLQKLIVRYLKPL